MLARCARCQNTFTTDRFGVQSCPHCGSEIRLDDPNAPAQPAPPGASWKPPEPQAPAGAGGSAGWAPPPPADNPAAAAGGWAPPPSGGGGTGVPPGPPGAPPPGGLQSAPFARRAQLGFVKAYLDTWKLASVEPAAFFKTVRTDETGSAVWFGVISITLGTWVAGLFGLATVGMSMAFVQSILREAMKNAPGGHLPNLTFLTTGFMTVVTIGMMVAAPLFAVIRIYLGALLVHLFLMLFKGADRGFDATLTTVSYGSGTWILQAVPGCGGLVAIVWYVVVLIIGLGEAQRCGPGKAAAAVFAPVVLFCCCCCGLEGFGLSMGRFAHEASSGFSP